MFQFLRFVLKSAGRNRRRTALTVLGVAASLFLLVSLRTLLGELEGQSGLTPTSALRLITYDSVSWPSPCRSPICSASSACLASRQ